MMEKSRQFHHEDILDRAVDAVLREPLPGELSPEKRAQLTAVVCKAAQRPEQVTLWQRISAMRPLAKIAVAASALIVLVGLWSWFVPGGGVAAAFADVAEALHSVQSATWKMTSETQVRMPGDQTEPGRTVKLESNCMFLTPAHERREMTNGGVKSINIMDGEQSKAITLLPATKTAVVVELKNLPAGDSPFGRTFQGLRELVVKARDDKANEVKRLGRQSIDGRAAEGYQFHLGAIEVTLWADEKTLLPVRAEYNGSDPKTSVVMTDFQFNVPLDASLFNVDVPPGYTIQQTAQIDVSKPFLLITEALETAAKCNDGVFPPALQGEQGVLSVIQRGMPAMMEKLKDNPDEMRKLGMKLAMQTAGFLGFVNAAPPDAIHYAGKDVKLGAPNRPILWINRKKSDRVIVIFADLNVKEMPADEMPPVPASEERGATPPAKVKPAP